MATVTTDLLKEGMILEAPVKNLQGQLLFPTGHALKEKHIEMMQAWGIPDADVVVEITDEEAQRLEELMERTKDKLKPKFKRSDIEHPAVKEIIRYCAERIVENAERK